jgi:hypothetical protein
MDGMRKLLLAIAILLSYNAFADVYVNGYYRQNGTYVEPHYRSSPNGTTLDNFSTQGNVNPYTGQAGTVNPYTTNTNPYLFPIKPVDSFDGYRYQDLFGR